VVAGATLEDYYTSGLEGDVIARSGNTLTVRGATLEYLTERQALAPVITPLTSYS